MGRMLKLAIIVAAVVVGSQLGIAQASAATAIDGHCGTHLGNLLQRNSSGSLYGFRIGPRDGHSGGSYHCTGTRYVNGRARSGWVPFDLPSWNWHGKVEMMKTGFELAGACAAFGGAFIGEVPSGTTDTVITASAGLACADGVQTMWDKLPAGAANDSAKVRLLK